MPLAFLSPDPKSLHLDWGVSTAPLPVQWCDSWENFPSLVQKRGFFHGGFPRFLLFGVKILCNKNEASLYPCLVVAVSTPGLLDVVVSTPKLLDVAISTPDRLYSDDTVFCWLFTWKNLYSFFHVPCYISVVAIFFSYLILDKKENLNRKNLK